MKISDKIEFVLLSLTAAGYVTTVVLNALGGIGNGILFQVNVASISDKYTVYITPAGWAFSIWSLIYIWLALGIIYCVVILYRSRNSDKDRPLFWWPFYVSYIINYILNTLWIFLWLDENLVGSAIVLVLIAYTGWLTIGFACKSSHNFAIDNESSLNKSELVKYIFVQNGIAVYASWTTAASMLNINIAFQYTGKFDAESCSLASLSLLLIICLIWFVLENTVFDTYVRYIITQYPVIIFASSAILDKQKKVQSPASVPESVYILTCVVVAISVTQFIVRIAIVLYRSRPLFVKQNDSRKIPEANQQSFLH